MRPEDIKMVLGMFEDTTTAVDLSRKLHPNCPSWDRDTHRQKAFNMLRQLERDGYVVKDGFVTVNSLKHRVWRKVEA